METVKSFLEHHAYEGGRAAGQLTYEYARELLCDAIADGLLCDAESVDEIDIPACVDAANRAALKRG